MRKNKRIDDSLRLEIIQEYLSGSSKYSLLKKYNLKYSKSISNWMRIFGIEDHLTLTPPGFMKNKDSKETSKELKELQLENKRLKVQLAKAELRAKVYDTMIDVAEEMFHIPIRKKPGTKQS